GPALLGHRVGAVLRHAQAVPPARAMDPEGGRDDRFDRRADRSGPRAPRDDAVAAGRARLERERRGALAHLHVPHLLPLPARDLLLERDGALAALTVLVPAHGRRRGRGRALELRAREPEARPRAGDLDGALCARDLAAHEAVGRVLGRRDAHGRASRGVELDRADRLPALAVLALEANLARRPDALAEVRQVDPGRLARTDARVGDLGRDPALGDLDLDGLRAARSLADPVARGRRRADLDARLA